MRTQTLDSYIHKTVESHRKGYDLKFATSQSLFSSNVIDVGTNLLLRVIARQSDRVFENCLDLGCGYGALGIPISASGLAKSVEMVDRDALAVDFAANNVAENGISNVETHASLGLDGVSSDNYDIIVSNLPGKVGPVVLQHFLTTAARRLSPNGEFWGVVVNPVWPQIERFLGELEVRTLHIEQAPRHTAFGFRVDSPAILEGSSDSLAEIYSRDKVDFAVGKRSYGIETSRGVAEFDDLSYSTRLLLEQLYEVRKERWDEAVVFNVSQGYVPIALRASGITRTVHLVDRDLLALRTSERNLRINGFNEPVNELHHQVSWIPEESQGQAEIGLIVGSLRGDEPRHTLEISAESIAEDLETGGTAVIAGGSTPITRMLKVFQARKGIHLVNRDRNRGSSVVILRKAPQLR